MANLPKKQKGGSTKRRTVKKETGDYGTIRTVSIKSKKTGEVKKTKLKSKDSLSTYKTVHVGSGDHESLDTQLKAKYKRKLKSEKDRNFKEKKKRKDIAGTKAHDRQKAKQAKKRSHSPAYPDLSELEKKQKGGGISKVEPQVITGFGTGPNYTAGNTPWYKEGGNITKREKRAGKAYAKGKDKKGNRILDKNTKGMDKFKKGGSQNGPTGFGY